ncbi:MAG: tetratricopeptide repeat protein [Myxococcota bacterium]
MARNAFEIRLELAQGHWDIGEYEEALLCLERALSDARGGPQDPRLAELASALAGGLTWRAGDAASSALRARLDRVVTQASEVESLSSPLATPTLAGLLLEQGHPQQARRVAEEALRRRPEDPRARAVWTRLAQEEAATSGRPRRQRTIEELERWLVRLRARFGAPEDGERSSLA